jgi:hypothetical protein
LGGVARAASGGELTLEQELDGVIVPEAAERRQIAAAADHAGEALRRLVPRSAGVGNLPGELALGVSRPELEYAVVLELLGGAAVEPGCGSRLGTEGETERDEGDDKGALFRISHTA